MKDRKSRKKRNRASWLWTQYRLRPEDYEKMWEKQDKFCAICWAWPEISKPKRIFPVDHDHDTGEIRGILCHACNKALGLFRDDPEILYRAAEYLNKS